jgi:transposase
MARVMAGTGAGTGAGTVSSERVEIVTRGERRRSFSAEEKVRLVAETFRPGETVTVVSRRLGICMSLLRRWRRAARGEVPSRRASRPQLLPVRLVAPDADIASSRRPSPAVADIAPAPIEVVLRNRRVLRVAATTDTARAAVPHGASATWTVRVIAAEPTRR